MSDDLPHASIASDPEFNVLLRMTIESANSGDGSHREYRQWDAEICRDCGCGDEIVSSRRRKGEYTLRRHSCERCGTHGSTVILARPGPDPAEMWTAGDVQLIDLKLPENAPARGTVLPTVIDANPDE